MSNKLDTPLVGLQNPPGTAVKRGNAGTVELEEIPFPELVDLRGNPQDGAFGKVVAATIGAALPIRPNTISESASHIIHWLGPDEWLIRSKEPLPEGGQLAARLLEALKGQFSAVTDQSSAYSVMQLRGPQARAVLNKGCPLDLHPSVFGAGQCAQSHYFNASVLLRPLDATGDAWELTVRRSFADATARIALDAMQEFI
ncbi:MAG: sarcosine oxidase subunit gamma family protein [Lautropia sp.]|nr:sarcosine oxidase subunit gamma family protein [Lautropia sp.]